MTPPESALASSGSSQLATGTAPVVPFTTGEFCVPPSDLGDFAKLSDFDKERVLMLLGCFERIASGNVVSQCKAIALQMSAVRGYSWTNLRNLYYDYKEKGWRALVRGYRGPQSLPPEFVEFFRLQCEKNSRSIRAQIAVVQRAWLGGAEIPGYGTWQEWFLKEFPDRDVPMSCPAYPNGWSQSNLYNIQPPKAERTLATRGYADAKKYMLSMERDPSKLRPLELIVVDDFEADQLCVYHDPEKGIRQVVRVSGILAMDVCTRRKLSLGMKPRIENDEGRKESILRRELRYMLYCLLSEYGMPVDYPITILCENASAAIEHDFEMALGRLFSGRIRVTRTGLINQRTLENGFVQRGGKPWEKGWIESAFNAMANIAAVLPGQKGASYQKKPAELAAKILYTERLLSTGARGLNLSEEQVAKLQTPFLSKDELLQAYEVVFSLLEARTNHKLLGFDRVQLWRRNEAEVWQEWDALALLPAQEQVGIIVEERAESPAERWAKLNSLPECRREKIAEHVLAALLLQPKKAKLKNGRVTFIHQGKTYTFADRQCYALNEREGEEVLCFFDEAKPDCVHVYDAKGRHVQTIAALKAADITDPAAISAAATVIKTLENQTINAVRARHSDQAREVAGMIQHNEGIAPGVHLDASVRRSLGLKVDEAKALASASLTGTLAAGKTAGPIAGDALSGAAALAAAARRVDETRKTTAKTERETKRAIDDAERELDSSDVSAAFDRPTEEDPEHNFTASEIADLLRDDEPT